MSNNTFAITETYNTNNVAILITFNAFVNEGVGFAQVGYRVIDENGEFHYNTRTIDIVDSTRVENACRMIKDRLANLVNSSIVADRMMNLVGDYLEGKLAMN